MSNCTGRKSHECTQTTFFAVKIFTNFFVCFFFVLWFCFVSLAELVLCVLVRIAAQDIFTNATLVLLSKLFLRLICSNFFVLVFFYLFLFIFIFSAFNFSFASFRCGVCGYCKYIKINLHKIETSLLLAVRMARWCKIVEKLKALGNATNAMSQLNLISNFEFFIFFSVEDYRIQPQWLCRQWPQLRPLQ